MSRVHLPVVAEDRRATGAVRKDGKRPHIVPADVHGRFATARKIAFAFLILFWASLPWIPIHGAPAVFVDVEARKFFLFGATFNAQDGWLLFFPVSAMAFALVVSTAVAGRAWCGWACPQTVFLEGVYRPIERLVLGSRDDRRKREATGTWLQINARKVVLQAIFLVISAFLAHVVLAYFVSIPRAFAMVRSAPSAHVEAFAWTTALTLILFGNFAWFREQFCVVMCPYGRLQSVLVDDDSLVVGYDVKRGEPRGKKGKAQGDCVDCNRCVVVCPTGIDIREGLQLDCVACTACIDACDEVMDKLERPRGLVRYDSTRGLRGEPKRVMRARLGFYAVLGLVGIVAASLAFRSRVDFECNVLRLPGAPYIFTGDTVRNSFDVHLVNKRSESVTYDIEVKGPPELVTVVSTPELTVDGLADRHVPIFFDVRRERYAGDFTVDVIVRPRGKDARTVKVTFLGAKK